jgi:antirestriction protein ArdC
MKTQSVNASTSTAVDKMGEAITNELLKIMGDGSPAYEKQWRETLTRWTANGMPYNADNGRAYSGGNVIQLLMTGAMRGFESNGWMTYGAMQKRGFTIRKGCKAPWQWVLSPRMAFDKKDKNGNKIKNADGTDAKVMGPQRAYKVFNVDCIDTHGKPLPGARKAQATEPDYRALDELVAHHQVALFHGGNVACYKPKADTVHMPPRASFKTEGGYYATLAHELTHWTGGEKRLDRKLMEQGGFGSPGYAFEELIAELGAAFTMARFGMAGEQMPQHASYLASWIKRLKDDKTFILKASTQACKACAYLTGYMDKAEDASAVQSDTVAEDDVPEAEAPHARAA